MLYRIDYTRPTADDPHGADFDRYLEAPAHRRGRIPAALLTSARSYGIANGAHEFTVAAVTLPRIGYPGHESGPWAGTNRPHEVAHLLTVPMPCRP